MSCPFHPKGAISFWSKIKNLFSFRITSNEKFSAENIKAILDNSISSIITINENRIILSFNKAAEKDFGYSKEEVIGKNVNCLMPEPFHNEHDSYVNNYLRTGKKKIIGIGREVVAKRKDGSTFPIQLAVSEVLVGNTRFFTGIIRDLTEEKKAQALLFANIRMESEAHTKNEYLSILSHELKTPLTSIYASLGLLLDEKGLTEKMKELLSIAYRTSQRLSSIIKDVLEVEKIQFGKIKMEKIPVSIGYIVEEAMATEMSMAAKMDVFFIKEDPFLNVLVFADATRLIQVMVNLLSNAIKFSPAQGKIFISIKILEKMVRVSVRDQGKGIPEDIQVKLFTPFVQGSNQNARTVGGTGLGLHICKLIIGQLDGKIGFKTEKDVGSTFYFDLPITKLGDIHDF